MCGYLPFRAPPVGHVLDRPDELLGPSAGRLDHLLDCAQVAHRSVGTDDAIFQRADQASCAGSLESLLHAITIVDVDPLENVTRWSA